VPTVRLQQASPHEHAPHEDHDRLLRPAGISFAVAVCAVVLGICYIPVDPWIRAFLALGSLFLVTSSFTLAKCVRDAQDSNVLTTRLDQARMDKILAEHDPFREPV